MRYVPSTYYMPSTVLSFEYLLLILFHIVQMLFRHEAFLNFPKVITLLQKAKTFLHSSITTLIPYPFCCPLNNNGPKAKMVPCLSVLSQQSTKSFFEKWIQKHGSEIQIQCHLFSSSPPLRSCRKAYFIIHKARKVMSNTNTISSNHLAETSKFVCKTAVDRESLRILQKV